MVTVKSYVPRPVNPTPIEAFQIPAGTALDLLIGGEVTHLDGGDYVLFIGDGLVGMTAAAFEAAYQPA